MFFFCVFYLFILFIFFLGGGGGGGGRAPLVRTETAFTVMGICESAVAQW